MVSVISSILAWRVVCKSYLTFLRLLSESLAICTKPLFISLPSCRQVVAVDVFSVDSTRSCFTVFCRASISFAWAVIFASICHIQSPSFAPPGVGALSGGEPVDSILPRFAPLSLLLLLFLDDIFVRKIQIFTTLLRTPPIQAPFFGPCWGAWIAEPARPDTTAQQHPLVRTDLRTILLYDIFGKIIQ